jgi:hypothetical protein
MHFVTIMRRSLHSMVNKKRESQMGKSGLIIKSHTSAGDTAVSGLFNGVQAGVAMAVVIVIFSLLAGQGLVYLSYFSSGAPVTPLQGLAGHLAVSSIYGMLYALVRRWTRLNHFTRLPGWLAGVVYALGLWVFAMVLLLPAAKSLFLTLPWAVLFAGHIAYGLVLGFRQKP